MTNIRPGQIWQEDDKRFTRFIVVVSVGKYIAKVRTCNEAGEVVPRGRPTNARVDRFERFGGYKYIRETA